MKFNSQDEPLRDDFAVLERQHAEINVAVGELMDLLKGHSPASMQVLSEARNRIARLVSSHMKNEEEILFAPLRRRRLSGGIPCYASIIATTRELRLRYSAHIGRWPARAIDADWDGYRRSTIALHLGFAALRERKMAEFYPAAEQMLSRAERRDLWVAA